jgi:hypothetical protein
MPRASWRGFLRLSLVSCPIYLSPATTRTKPIRLHQVWQPAPDCGSSNPGSPAQRRNAMRSRKSGSHETPRWREMDSNCRSPATPNSVGLHVYPISGEHEVACRDKYCLSRAVGPVRRVRLPKRSTVTRKSRWIVWSNPCATRGRARAAAGSASPRTRPKHWRRRWPSARRLG